MGSSITYTRGKEWWLERTSDMGTERYPDIIKVGKFGKERIYVPEKRYKNKVDVIRCRDCKHKDDWLDEGGQCGVDPNGFCSWAEREDKANP